MNELTKAAENKQFDSLHSKEYKPAIAQKKETFLVEAGIYGWEECKDIEAVVESLNEGDELILKHEVIYGNDIAFVYDKSDRKIGSVGGGNRKIIARLMGAGKTFKAVLSPTEPEITEYEKPYPEQIRRREINSFLNMKIYWVE